MGFAKWWWLCALSYNRVASDSISCKSKSWHPTTTATRLTVAAGKIHVLIKIENKIQLGVCVNFFVLSVQFIPLSSIPLTPILDAYFPGPKECGVCVHENRTNWHFHPQTQTETEKQMFTVYIPHSLALETVDVAHESFCNNKKATFSTRIRTISISSFSIVLWNINKVKCETMDTNGNLSSSGFSGRETRK